MAIPGETKAKHGAVLCDIGGARGAILTRDALCSTVEYIVPSETVDFAPGGIETRGIATLKYAPVCDSYGVRMGSVGDTSFSWAVGACLPTEVVRCALSSMSDDEFLASLTAGQFAIDYALGKLYYCKLDDTDSDTCTYYTRQQSLQVRTLCENQESWDVNVYTIGSFGTGQALPDIACPNGMRLVIRAHPDNAGNVYLSYNKVGAETAATRLQLGAGQAVTLYLANANLVWWDASQAGQKVEVYVEVAA